MPQRETATLLQDIVDASEAILRFSAGWTVNDYEQDDYLRSAVERKFTIIGEALRTVMAQDPALRSRISAARDIVDFRNLLVHSYSEIENARVWEYIQTDLPVLLAEVRALLPSP